MKKRIPAKSTRIWRVELYWEDVWELVSIFKNYCETVEISDDKAIYESLDEAAKKITSTITNLEIAGKNPNVNLSLKTNGSWLTQRFDKTEMTDKELDQLDLLFFRVKGFLDERGSKSYGIFGPAPTLLGIALIIVTAGSIFFRKPTGYGGIAFVVAWLLIVAWLMAARSFSTEIGTVSLKSKASVTSFWGRNKDAVKLLIIGAALGTCGTLLVEWLKAYLQKK